MKISAKDEYGLRILLRIAATSGEHGLTIPQLSEAEGLSQAYVAKIARLLRIAGFVKSNRGYKGGYVLSMPAENITIKDVLNSLDGNLYDDNFCGNHAGNLMLCTNSVQCSVKSLWKMVQFSVDQVLEKVTVRDLIQKGNNAHNHMLENLGRIEEHFASAGAPFTEH